MTLEAHWVELLGTYSRDGDSVFADYQNYIVNGELSQYQNIVQYGKKAGETLESHILNGIGVLETLRSRLHLEEMEARTLYTAFTIHDINKARDDQRAFAKIATSDNLAREINRLKLGDFFPEWEQYLADISLLVQSHSGHLHVGGGGWIAKHELRYGLGLRRVNVLVHLMRAADVIGLSHTLQEHTHKATFLSHLNAYLADSQIDEQYVFHTHQLVEQRGLLSNVLHNALMDALREAADWLPLLLYPDGVAYLGYKGAAFDLDYDSLARLGKHVNGHLSEILFGNPADLLKQTAQGIKFKPDALVSGLRFEPLLRQARNLVSRRKFKYEDLEANARKRAAIPKALSQDSDLTQALQTRLDDPTQLIQASESRMRSAELARTFYIFLNDHFPTIKDKWPCIYRLLELPEDYYPLYECFEARYDRCYVLASDITLSEEEVYQRIAEAGQALLDELAEVSATVQEESDQGNLWTQYLRLYLTVDGKPVSTGTWEDHLSHYIKYQHHQCAHCSGPFQVGDWRKADVREEIDVQKFSNRLRGGGNEEPVKQICEVCRTQFLLEALNFPSSKNENTLYLHLFPRSFLTPPYVRGLEAAIKKVQNTDIALQALNMDVDTAVERVRTRAPIRPRFRDRTPQGEPQRYGIYLPYYERTMAGVLIFPITTSSKWNDTEQYMFSLWNALVLQRALNMKASLSKDAVPLLSADEIPNLFLDMFPLACTGLLPRNDYDDPALDSLWQRTFNLFGLKRLFFEDETLEIVRAMSRGPLHVFFIMDRLLEKKDLSRLVERAFPYVNALALELGGDWMAQLSEILTDAAQLGWKLRGTSLKRSSLLYPVSEVLSKMAMLDSVHDAKMLKAATAEEIFNHLDRIRTKVGFRTLDTARQFVDIWYDDILYGVYQGSLPKLLADEKLLRSAYLFYVHEQIQSKNQP